MLTIELHFIDTTKFFFFRSKNAHTRLTDKYNIQYGVKRTTKNDTAENPPAKKFRQDENRVNFYNFGPTFIGSGSGLNWVQRSGFPLAKLRQLGLTNQIEQRYLNLTIRLGQQLHSDMNQTTNLAI